MEKAYDMLRRDGLLIKLHRRGIGGNIFNWIIDFLSGRTIQVRIGSVHSEKHVVENDTHPGSVRRPLLFSVMINDILESTPLGMG